VVETPESIQGRATDEKRHLPVVQTVKTPTQQMGIPRMACSTCTLGPECTEYQEGYVCAFEEKFSGFGATRDLDEIETTMVALVGDTVRRYHMAAMQEKVISGGAISPEVSSLSQMAVSQLRQLAELRRTKQSVKLTQEVSGKKGGILSQLFGAATSAVSNSVELNPPGVGTVDERQTVTVELTQDRITR
jgi:hypothetical protein